MHSNLSGPTKAVCYREVFATRRVCCERSHCSYNCQYRPGLVCVCVCVCTSMCMCVHSLNACAHYFGKFPLFLSVFLSVHIRIFTQHLPNPKTCF